MDDLIDRQAAIDALWKALFEYEDKTEMQFQKSDELDVADWIVHRIFVQNMSDIDRQTILQLPSAQPELIKKVAYIRGFEQGRTQGMIDAQERKKMNRQRKVLITITYNEMGIIIDTKAEELDSSAQLERKTGRWIDYPIADGCIQCSACGVLRMGEPSNYCPK